MADRAEEIFTMQLARAAGKQANKFLHKRGLQKADRDDVISAALLWCWVNRDNYSLTTTLETWFMNALRNAYQDLRRAEMPVAEDSLAILASTNNGDETFNTISAKSSAEALVRALTPEDREVAALTMQGFTRADMIKKGVPEWTIREANQRIKQLRRFLPEPELRTAVRRRGVTPRTPNLDELDENPQAEPSGIDKAIERLDFPPPSGKDCPPCWRCMWFEGFMPDGKISTRMVIEDKEVNEAVSSVEARKVEIAQWMRDGNYLTERL